jgi:hypothetical protein
MRESAARGKTRLLRHGFVRDLGEVMDSAK